MRFCRQFVRLWLHRLFCVVLHITRSRHLSSCMWSNICSSLRLYLKMMGHLCLGHHLSIILNSCLDILDNWLIIRISSLSSSRSTSYMSHTVGTKLCYMSHTAGTKLSYMSHTAGTKLFVRQTSLVRIGRSNSFHQKRRIL